MWYLLKNSLAVKKKVQPCLKWPVWKELWNQRGWPRNGCDGIGWWQSFINNNLGEFLVKLGWGNTNWPESLLLKLCHQPIPSQPFLCCPLWFNNSFLTGFFKQGHTFFLQPGCFWVDDYNPENERRNKVQTAEKLRNLKGTFHWWVCNCGKVL